MGPASTPRREPLLHDGDGLAGALRLSQRTCHVGAYSDPKETRELLDASDKQEVRRRAAELKQYEVANLAHRGRGKYSLGDCLSRRGPHDAGARADDRWATRPTGRGL